MNIRALAPIGALGLGALAVTWLDLGSAVSPSSDDPSSSFWTVRPAGRMQPGTEPTPGPTLASPARKVDGRSPRRPAASKARPVYRTTLVQLGKQPRWDRFLKIWCSIPTQADPARRLAGLERTLATTSNPITRQNLIFLAALALPTEVSAPWLREVRAGLDPEDA